MEGRRHQRKWFSSWLRYVYGILPLLLVIVLTQNAGALPIESTEDQGTRTAVEGSVGLEFPNTGFIPGDLTEQLSIDQFFSLWFVFLDDDVFTSGNGCL